MCGRSCTRIRILRVDCEFLNYDFVITRGKVREDKESMPEFIKSIRGITSGFNKTNGNIFFNHSSSAPSPPTVWLLATTANSICKTNTVLRKFGNADSHGKKNQLLWWVNNLKLCNDQMVTKPQAQVLIQTDASRKGWGLHLEE